MIKTMLTKKKFKDFFQKILLLYKNERARSKSQIKSLTYFFIKTQSLSDDQKKIVVDLLSAFLLKDSLAKQLA